MPTYTTIADLLASNNRQPFATVLVLGAGSAGDGGGGVFYWDRNSTATADGEIILAVPGVSTGRWILIIGNALTPTYEKGDMLVNNGNGLTRLPKPSAADLVLTSDVDGALGVAWAAAGGGGSVGPASLCSFLAFASSLQVIPNSGAITTVTFATIGHNWGSDYDNGTSIFTVPITGLYRFDYLLSLGLAGGGASFYVDSGISVGAGGLVTYPGTRQSPIDTSGTEVIQHGYFEGVLTAGETVRIKASQNGTAGASVQSPSMFSGRLVSTEA